MGVTMEYILVFIFIAAILFVLISSFNNIVYGCKCKYRNPYDRSSKICGRHEVAHGWSETSSHWWEVFSDGDKSKH